MQGSNKGYLSESFIYNQKKVDFGESIYSRVKGWGCRCYGFHELSCKRKTLRLQIN